MNTQECNDMIAWVYKACQDDIAALMSVNQQFPTEIADCFNKNSCTREQKEKGLDKACPVFKKTMACYWPALPCIPAGNDEMGRFASQLNQLKTDCETTDSQNTGSSFVISEGFTYTMPWALLLLFFV